MNKLIGMRERVVEISEKNDWSANISSDDGDNFRYEFSKTSPAGHDFNFEVDMLENSIDILLHEIFETYENFDVSSEAYIWLDNTGHGTNGAPYDMKEVYEDMEECKNMILALYDALREENWDYYYEED